MPAWASRCKKGKKATCKPSPKAYGAFVTALGRRYSGALRRREPGRRRAAARAPLVAAQRAQPAGLADAAVRAQEAPPRRHGGGRLPGARDGGDQGPAGERPRPRPDPARRDGADRAHERVARAAPDRAGRVPAQALLPQPERAPPARRRRARRTAAASSSASRSRASPTTPTSAAARGRPPSRPQAAGEITISSPSRLRRVLDQAARARRIPRGLPVFYTEFGFQTNPPDRIFGVRAALQAGYINQSDWMAYRDRRVRAVAQYKLIDEASLSSFQSGLRFVDGRAEARLRRLPAADLGQRPRLAAAGLRAGAPGRGLDAAGRPDPEPAAERRAPSRRSPR